MRLFTGIDLPDNVISDLDQLIAHLKPAAHINWSDPKNLHITTKFIGEWPEERLADVTEALRNLPPQPPISIQVERLGFFPNPHSPRVFWAGVKASDGLAALAQDTEEALAQLNIEKEKREYSPHLTLARIKTPGRLTRLLREVAELPSLEFGNFTADRFFLYESRTAPSGSVYTKLSEFPLTK